MNTEVIAAAGPHQSLLIAAALVNGHPTPIQELCQKDEAAAA